MNNSNFQIVSCCHCHRVHFLFAQEAAGGLAPRAMKARLSKDFQFESAHTLPRLPEGHKCRELHGHSFKAEIVVEGEIDPVVGWVYDHSRISEAVDPVIEIVDHAYLNDIEGLESPTIETLAVWFWKKLEPTLPGLAEVIIHETPKVRCMYRGD
jgi:6-pyruvoyltetrahydropterin/6-carboxytetrahydropterin synthase